MAAHPAFQTVMLSVICLNGIALMMVHADQPTWMDQLDLISSITFQVINPKP